MGGRSWSNCGGAIRWIERSALDANNGGRAATMKTSRRSARSTSNDAATQRFVFAGEQLLREIVAALVGVAACPGKVLIDARASGAAKVMRERQNLRGRFTCVDLGLGERAGGAHCEKLRCHADEAREHA